MTYVKPEKSPREYIFKPVNTKPPTDDKDGWNALGFCIIYYDTNGCFKNQPQQYGTLINIPADGRNEQCQIWISQTDFSVKIRHGNNNPEPMADKTFSPAGDGYIPGGRIWV